MKSFNEVQNMRRSLICSTKTQCSDKRSARLNAVHCTTFAMICKTQCSANRSAVQNAYKIKFSAKRCAVQNQISYSSYRSSDPSPAPFLSCVTSPNPDSAVSFPLRAAVFLREQNLRLVVQNHSQFREIGLADETGHVPGQLFLVQIVLHEASGRGCCSCGRCGCGRRRGRDHVGAESASFRHGHTFPLGSGARAFHDVPLLPVGAGLSLYGAVSADEIAVLVEGIALGCGGAPAAGENVGTDATLNRRHALGEMLRIGCEGRWRRNTGNVCRVIGCGKYNV